LYKFALGLVGFLKITPLCLICHHPLWILDVHIHLFPKERLIECKLYIACFYTLLKSWYGMNDANGQSDANFLYTNTYSKI